MTDPILPIAVSAYLLKDGIKKMLGPSCEYIGGELKNLVEKANINVNDVFKRALEKLGKNIENPGGVPPKVLRKIVEEAAFNEDNLSKEYLAGLLAYSRSKNSSDDTCLPFLNMLSNQPRHVIQFHYSYYTWFKNLFDGTYPYFNLLSKEIIWDLYFRINFDEFKKMAGLQQGDNSNGKAVYIYNCLMKTDLITGGSYKTVLSIESENIIKVAPSTYGIILFLWIYGYKHINPSKILDTKILINPIDGIYIPNTKISKFSNRYLQKHEKAINKMQSITNKRVIHNVRFQ